MILKKTKIKKKINKIRKALRKIFFLNFKE